MITLVLTAPVVLWPLFLSQDISQIAYVQVYERWTISMAILLLVAVTADSVLAGFNRFTDLLFSLLWIVGAGMLITFALHSDRGGYLLAAALAAHGFRSVPAIWYGRNDQWWRWPAWLRDTGISMYLFGCLMLGIA